VREREQIEADAGADTKTTTKMQKRENKRKKNRTAIETHTWLRWPRRSGFSHRLGTPTPPLTLP
jgi:hypothetical protein